MKAKCAVALLVIFAGVGLTGCATQTQLTQNSDEKGKKEAVKTASDYHPPRASDYWFHRDIEDRLALARSPQGNGEP